VPSKGYQISIVVIHCYRTHRKMSNKPQKKKKKSITKKSIKMPKKQGSFRGLKQAFSPKKSPSIRGGKKNVLEKYEMHEIIGEGAFGRVCRATRVADDAEFAIKCLKIKNIKNSNMINTVRKEVAVMQKIPQHKHCVNMIEVLQSDSYLYIVVELVKGGQLFDIINNSPNKRLPEAEAREYFKQMLSGLEFLHSQKIVHRDLKLENILVHEDGYVMISDFGLSGTRKNITNKNELKDIAGSPNYVAPEILSGRGYDGYAADIWSSGVILYALLAGFLPFEDNDFKKLFALIVDCNPQFPKWFNVTAVHLMAKIFVVDPEARITLPQIKEHAFYLGIDVHMDKPGMKEEEVLPRTKPPMIDEDDPPQPPTLPLRSVMTDYGDDPDTDANSPPPPKETEKLTVFDLVGAKFQKMVTGVLRRDSSAQSSSQRAYPSTVDGCMNIVE